MLISAPRHAPTPVRRRSSTVSLESQVRAYSTRFTESPQRKLSGTTALWFGGREAPDVSLSALKPGELCTGSPMTDADLDVSLSAMDTAMLRRSSMRPKHHGTAPADWARATPDPESFHSTNGEVCARGYCASRWTPATILFASGSLQQRIGSALSR